MTDRSANSSPGQGRQEFMSTILDALGRDRVQPPLVPAPVVDDSIVRLCREGEDLAATFTRGAEAVGMIVRRVDAGALLPQVVSLMAELNIKRAATAVTTLPAGSAELDDALRAADIDVVNWRDAGGADALYDVDAGITDVHAALAETGTLVCSVDAEHARTMSLVPTIHVAIVRTDDILPDMIDCWARFTDGGAAVPGSTSFITGPSKTADIEGQLVEGVHGPEKVYILLVEG